MTVRASNPPRERKPCIAPHADIVKDDALWARCEYVGIQEDYDDNDQRADLALANCTCGSTLSRPAPKQNPVPEGAVIRFGRERYETLDLAVADAIDAIDRSRGARRGQPRVIEMSLPGQRAHVEVARVTRHETRADRYTLWVLRPDLLSDDVWSMNGNGGVGSRVRGLVGVVPGPGVTHPDDAQPTAAHAPYVFNVDTDWDPPITSFYTAVADAIEDYRARGGSAPTNIEYGERTRDARGNEAVEPLGVVATVESVESGLTSIRLTINHPGLVPGEVTTGDAAERARKMRTWRGCQDVYAVDVQWSPRAAGPTAPTNTMTANEEARGLIERALHLAPGMDATRLAFKERMLSAVENEMAIAYPGGAFAVIELHRTAGAERFEYEVQRRATMANYRAVDRERRPYSLQRPPFAWLRDGAVWAEYIPIAWTAPTAPTQLEQAIADAISISLAPPDNRRARQFVAAIWEQMLAHNVTMESAAAFGPAYFASEARVATSRIADAPPGPNGTSDRWVWQWNSGGGLVSATFPRTDAAPAFDATVASSVTAPLVEQAVSRALGLSEHDPEPRRAARFVRAVIQRAREDVGGTLRGPFDSGDFLFVIVESAQSIATLQRPAAGLSCWVWRDPERNNEPVAILRNDAASRPGVTPHDYAQARVVGTPAARPRQDFTRQPDRVPEAARPIAEAMTSTRPPEPPRPITEWTSPEDAMRRRFEQLEQGDTSMGLSPLDHSILLRGNLPLNTRVRLRRTVLRSEPEHKQFPRGSAGRVIFNNNDGPFVVVKLDNNETVEWDAIHFEQMAGDLEVEPDEVGRYRAIETSGKSALGRSLLEQSERFRAALHVGERVRLRRPVLRGHEQFKRGAAGEVITNDTDPTGQRFVTVRLDQGLLVEWGPTHLEQLAGDLELEPEQASRYRAIELNPALKNNPAWVTGILAKHFELLESKVPARWLPRLTDAKAKGGKLTAALKEYGCGAYGCVLPTLDPKVVLKVTTDDTEYQFANELAGDLAVQVTVDYHLVAALPEKRGGRATYLLWRDAAEHVGKVNEVLGRGERGAQAVEDAINDQHAAAQKAFVDLMEGRDAKKSLAKWEAACNEMGRLVPELRELADGMIRNLHESGVLVSDVHGGNVGLVGEQWLIVDPGNVVAGIDVVRT